MILWTWNFNRCYFKKLCNLAKERFLKSLKMTQRCRNMYELTLYKEKILWYIFYSCTVHYGIYILFTHQQMHFLLNLEKFKFTLRYTQLSLLHVSVFDHPQGALQSLAIVIFLLKLSVKLCSISCGYVAACRETACVLFVDKTHAISWHAATCAHNIQRHNFTEYFNRGVTLARLCAWADHLIPGLIFFSGKL